MSDVLRLSDHKGVALIFIKRVFCSVVLILFHYKFRVTSVTSVLFIQS